MKHVLIRVHAQTEASEIEIGLMSRADEGAVPASVQKLPTHDLLFVPRDLAAKGGVGLARRDRARRHHEPRSR